MKKKLIITDYVHPSLISGFEKAGYTVDYYPNMLLAETAKIIQDYNGIIINSKTVMDKDMIDKAKKLSFIGRLGSGLEIIDIPYAESKGIRVINSPEGNRNAVAEHVMGMLLSLFNNINRGDKEVRNLDWNREKNRGQELYGKTIGIIGFGNTGRAFSEKLVNWNVKILAYDKYKSSYADDLSHVHETTIEDIQKNADIISLHLQLTPETKYFIDNAFYSKCKDGVILINSSRGTMINTKELLNNLDNGKVAGACLDVFENEKPNTFTEEELNIYQDLYNRENVILTPHVAGWTDRSLKLIADVLLDKILDSKESLMNNL